MGRIPPRRAVWAGALVFVLVGAWGLAFSGTAEAGRRAPVATMATNEVLDIAFDPARPLAYLVRGGLSTISVFSLASLTFTAEIPAGSGPRGLDVDPVTDRLYVALESGGIAVLDLATQSQVTTWPVGGTGLADVEVGRPGRLYASHAGSWGTGKIVNTSDGSLAGTFGAPSTLYGGSLLGISPDHRYLYVAEGQVSSGRLIKLDVQTDAPTVVAESQCSDFVRDMVQPESGAYLLVTCTANVSRYMTDTMEWNANYVVGSWARAAAVSPNGSFVFAGCDCVGADPLVMFHAAMGGRLDSFATTEDVFELGIDPTGRYLLVGTWVGTSSYGLEVYDLSLPANEPPVGAFTMTPDPGRAGEPVAFVADAIDPEGGGLTYAWDFGDGAQATGSTNTHVYAAVGTYTASLTVTDDIGLTDTATRSLTIEEAPPPPVDLEMWSHAAGFRLLVPVGWERQQDVSFEGSTIELLTLGPTRNGFQTNILLDTDRDSTVRETASYLQGLASEVIAGLRQDDPTIQVFEPTELREIGGHAAAVFAIRYPFDDLIQKVAVVVSDPHDRYWLLLLSVDESLFPTMDEAFERMLASFEVTLPAPTSSPLLLVAVFGGIAAVVGLAIALAVARSRRKRIPPPAPPQVAAPPRSAGAAYVPPPPPPGAGSQMFSCPRCAWLVPVGHRFCTRCGQAFAPPPPGPPPTT